MRKLGVSVAFGLVFVFCSTRAAVRGRVQTENPCV